MNRINSKLLAGIAGALTIASTALLSPVANASEPFIGTIKYVGFSFAPRGWATCEGQLLQISQNDALFSLFGTIYGGDGRTTFGLPDMRGRLPMHMGAGPGLSSRPIGQKGGQEQVTLDTNQIGHSHTLRATTAAGNQTSPSGHTLAKDGTDTTYLAAAPSVSMFAGSVGNTGGNQAHENRPPSLGVYCTVALVGVYPSRQ